MHKIPNFFLTNKAFLYPPKLDVLTALLWISCINEGFDTCYHQTTCVGYGMKFACPLHHSDLQN